MLNNTVDFKAKSFLSERNTSTMAYEVKAVRAVWDPSLSIPGTNRRGGFRCPVGTRYGGQITDRFGRSCGWGVARRIANQIADIGERFENIDDARRGRRVARRERRILERLNPQGGGAGRLERGLRDVAGRLDGGDAPSPAPRGARRRTVTPRPPSVDAPEADLTPEAPRAPRRRRAPNLRDSEQRRMDREIEQPGAPRTDEAPARPARPRRPVKPRGEGNLRDSEQRRMEREINEPGAPRTDEAPARRRRRAVVETAKPPKPQQEEAKKPEPIVEPKVVKPRRPKPMGTNESDPDERSERNVRNRFRQRGLPNDAYWRKPDYAGEDKNELERRFGRYYSEDNRRNARGNLVNERIARGEGDANRIAADIIRAFGENNLPVRQVEFDDIAGPGNSDNAARSAEVRAEAARQADAILADADRERAFEQETPDGFLRAFLPPDLRNLSLDEEREFREQWREEQNGIEDFFRNFDGRIADGDFGTAETLRERIRINNDEIGFANDRLERDLERLRELEGSITVAQMRARSQVRREALARIAVNAQDRRRRELKNKKFQEAIDEADKKPKTPKPKVVKQRAINLNDALRDDTFVERINRDVLGKRLEILNDFKNFTGANDRDAEAKKQSALRVAETNIIALTARLERIQQAQDRGDISPLDVVRGANREINVRELKEEIESVIDAWGDVVKHNKPPSAKKPKDAPNADIPEGWKKGPGTIITHQNGDIIDEAIGGKWFVVHGTPAQTKSGFNNREDAISWHKQNVLNQAEVPKSPSKPVAPEALKFEPQLAGVAKFTPENEALVERMLAEILTPEQRAQFGLQVDAYSFNENDGRQAAVRDFNYALLAEVEKYAQNPQQYGDVQNRLLAIQGQFLERIGASGNLRTKQQIEARLVELKQKQQENWNLLANPRGANDLEKERFRSSMMEKIAKNQGAIGRYEQGLSLLSKIEPEIRKAIQRQEQGLVFNPDASNVVKPLDEDVIKTIKSQIADAIKRRQGKLAKYLEKRDPNNTAKYIDMTKEKFDALPNAEKIAYIKEAYSHSKIEGSNGKLYNAVASVTGSGRSFGVQVTFNEIDKDGRVLRTVGSSSRTVNSTYVKQNTMFVTSKLDRGADIQTIYNQHAFLYLKKMGITAAKVGAVDDGKYVWARVGFINPRPLGRGDLSVLEKELKFFEKFGAGGLVSSEAEYMRIRSILSQARQGKTFSHQEIIFAIDDPSGNKPRGEFVKQWFVTNMGSGGGKLSFTAQKIGVPVRGARRAPRRRNA